MSPSSLLRVALIGAMPALSTLTIATPGWAQSQDATPALTRARQMYDQAEELVAAGKYQEALPIMQAAWLLKEHWQNAALLGLVELKTGHFRDTAEHTAIALRTASARASAETKVKLQAQLTEAKRKVTTVTFRGVDAGAKVYVDSKLVGNFPMPDPVFVEPGEHQVEIQKQGEPPMRRKIKGEVGGETVVDYVAPHPRPAPAAVTGAAPNPGPAASPTASPTQQSSRESDPRPVIGIAGGAATLVALGVGIGFWARASSLDSDARKLHGQYSAELSVTGCNPGGPHCSELANKFNDRDSARTVATVGLVTAGVLGAATLATVLLWPTEKSATTARAPRLWAAPQLGGAAGLIAGGNF